MTTLALDQSPAGPWARTTTRLMALCAVAAVAFVLELALGTVRIPFADVVSILLGATPADDSWLMIVRTVRLPRALTAAGGGAALGVSGLVLQTLFRNRLAGPWLLGVTGGARLGVGVMILVISWSGYFLPAKLGIPGGVGIALSASLGAGAALGAMALAARRVGTVSLLLLGVMITFLATGITSVLMHLVSEDQARVFEAWSDGNFGGVTWLNLQVLLPVLALGAVLAITLVKALDALLLGERYAQSMGVSVRRIRWLALAAVALLSGATTAFCGIVAFLDVAVPQLARGLMQSAQHRALLPATALLGAAVAMFADLLAHLPAGNKVLHLNAITAILGAPVVIWIVLRGRGSSRGGES
jgi:iron complex transport system permease protein